MPKAKLPIGIQDFEKLISRGYTYVDKTRLIYELAIQDLPYFLSRPRRFGKSLLISTLQALFTGRRDLFKGLWIDESDWEWVSFPTIRLDMSAISSKTPEIFESSLIRTLGKIALHHNVTIAGEVPSEYLYDLIDQLAPIGKVVVLVDEYDKALIDHIEDQGAAMQIRATLREFYAILKAQDGNLKFSFLSGITKFSKVSVFSGLNNLNDITMSDNYSALLGYTSEELESYFAPEIEQVAQVNGLTLHECYEQVREWYNGYRFSKHGIPVYNPFSTLKLLDSKNFASHWFETGTPTFLIDLLKKRQFDLANLEEIHASYLSFGSFDIEDLPSLPLLYQTGYLTIHSFLPEIDAYCLGFPNREVSQSFSECLIATFASSKAECNKFLFEISANLREKEWDYKQFFHIIEKLFALIPYDLYLRHEKYFHSLFYLAIKLAGFHIGAEIHTQQGRTDAALEMADKVIIFEFKLDENPQTALDQIKQKRYFQHFEDRKRLIYLVGINFNSKLRSIDGWQVEQPL